MKKAVLIIASMSLASGIAAAQEQDSDAIDRDIVTEDKPQFDPDRDIVTEDSLKPEMSLGEQKPDSPVQTDYGEEMAQSSQPPARTAGDSAMPARGLADMTAEDLAGKKVVTVTGEEIGEISEVGTSPGRTDRIAKVDVGGFLGVGEKTIAIPLSELTKSVSDEDSVRTSMTRETIEAEPEFDDDSFKAEE